MLPVITPPPVTYRLAAPTGTLTVWVTSGAGDGKAGFTGLLVVTL